MPGLLAELGRTTEALDRAARLMAALETRGDVYTLIEVRAVEQACRLALGEQAAQAKVDWIVETARTIGTVDINVVVFAAAAAALVESAPDQARARLAELDEAEGSRATPYYARALPGTIRTALAAGGAALAKRLTEVSNRAIGSTSTRFVPHRRSSRRVQAGTPKRPRSTPMPQRAGASSATSRARVCPAGIGVLPARARSAGRRRAASRGS